MRVALLKGDYDAAGGPETLLAALIPQLRSSGIEPIVIALVRDPSHRVIGMLGSDPSVTMHVISWSGLAAVPLVATRLAKVLREEHCQIVHTHDMRCALATFLARPFVKLPWLAHVHGWLGDTHRGVHAFYEKIDKRLVRHADAVAVGSRNAEAEVASLGIRRIEFVPNAVPIPGLDGESSAIRSDLGIAPGELLIGSVGRLQYGKGHDVFIRAFALLRSERQDIRALVVGTGPAAEELKTLAASLGLGGSLNFTGFVDAVEPYVRAMDVVAVPSRKESLPLTVLEAMALERPVAAARVGDLPDVINDGESGLIVPPEDVPALAAALRRLLADEPLRHRLGKAARQRVIETYSIPAMSLRLAEIYARMLK